MKPTRPLFPLLTAEVVERFWSLVDKRGPDDCWSWLGALSDGYGNICIEGFTLRAHRISWTLANGRELGQLCACHSCDNKPCVNPAHLWAGTLADNKRDDAAKGNRRFSDPFGTFKRRADALIGVPLSQRSAIASISHAEYRKAVEDDQAKARKRWWARLSPQARANYLARCQKKEAERSARR